MRTKARGKWIALALVLCLGQFSGLAPSPATAQFDKQGGNPDSPLVLDPDPRLLRPHVPLRLEPGSWIRMRTQASNLEGEFLAQQGDTLLWLGEPNLRTTTLAELDGVWVRNRSTRRGATLGALTGAGGGLVVGILFSTLLNELCEGDCDDGVGVTLSVMFVTIGGGALGGAAIGALVGSALPRWEPVYP